jgi:RNA polymerase sigma-32 factor
MAAVASWPSLTSEGGLAAYIRKVHLYPLLEAGEEYMLAKRWLEHGDRAAAHKLVTSHLRLVAKVAMGYRRYALPIADLVSEGNVGMMQAVLRFDPDRGFRLSTYAVWWIRASVQEYVLHS